MIEPMSKNLLLLTIFTTIGFLFLNARESVSEKPVVLFTDDDADKLRYSDSEWEKEVIPKYEEDSIPRPTILFQEPEVTNTNKGPTIITVTPADIFVIFKQNDSTLNLGSLEVWGEKWFLKKNVTGRVLPHIKITREGAELVMKSVHIPKGNFKFGIKIADENGQETTRKYRLKVK